MSLKPFWVVLFLSCSAALYADSDDEFVEAEIVDETEYPVLLPEYDQVFFNSEVLVVDDLPNNYHY